MSFPGSKYFLSHFEPCLRLAALLLKKRVLVLPRNDCRVPSFCQEKLDSHSKLAKVIFRTSKGNFGNSYEALTPFKTTARPRGTLTPELPY